MSWPEAAIIIAAILAVVIVTVALIMSRAIRSMSDDD